MSETVLLMRPWPSFIKEMRNLRICVVYTPFHLRGVNDAVS